MSHIIEFPKLGSIEEGNLSFLEADSLLFPHPFKRMFWISGVPLTEVRGNHGHRTCQELFVCMYGDVDISVRRYRHANGHIGCNWVTHRYELHFSEPKALHVGPLEWLEIEPHGPDTVIACLCSELYDEAEYLRDIDEFEALSKKQCAEASDA